MPNTIADCIVASGLTTTYCIRYSSLGGGILRGKFNPAGGQMSFTATPDVNNTVRTNRYGAGFGIIVGNAAPDQAHQNQGWINDHNLPIPLNAATIAALGLPAGFLLDETGLTDMSACNDWVDQVLRPTIAAAAVVPTPAATAAVSDPAWKQLVSNVNTALGTYAVSKSK